MHNTTYEETISAINLQETVDTTYEDNMSASNMIETMMSRATCTPSREFEGFRPLSIPARHGNQIYFGNLSDDAGNNVRNTGETYNSHFGEEEGQARSVGTTVKKEIVQQRS